MVDRAKYFVLALLFLVVAGVIAYDRWNSGGPEPAAEAGAESDRSHALVDSGEPPRVDPGPLQVEPKPAADRRKPGRESGPALVRGGSLVLPIDKQQPESKPARKTSGNRTRPNRAPALTPQPKKKPVRTGGTVHVVRSGESLEKIALHYYKTRKGIGWIVDANGLRDANTIYARQRLVIPARKDSTGRRGPARKGPARKRPRSYTVKAGDGDLYAICRRFYGTSGQGSRVARIMELNKLYSAEVASGTVLILPPK